MKLSEIFDQLRTGEFRLISVDGAPQGTIPESAYKTVARSVNLGLTQLHHRFALREGKLTLLLKPGLTRYTLTRAFALSNPKAVVKYIDDTAVPFMDDLAKVIGVRVPDGPELSLNQRDDRWSCQTPTTHLIEVPKIIVDQSPDLPDALKTDKLELIYQATHPLIDTSEDADIEPDLVEIELPYAFLEPLLYFVASRVHHPVSLDSEINPAMSYAIKFEQLCAALENANLAVNKRDGLSKFHERGFV